MTATRPTWSDDDVEAFRDLAHSFLAKECAPNEERWGEQQHIDREVWNKAGELGLLCPSIPERVRRGRRDVRARGGDDRGADAHDGAEPRHVGAQHDRRPLHQRLRHRGAEAALAAEDGLRRAGRRGRDDRAGHRIGPAEHQDQGDQAGRRVRHRRLEDLHHQRPAGQPGHRRRQDRPGERRQGHLADRRRDRRARGLQPRPGAEEDRPARPGHRRAVLRRRARAEPATCSAPRRARASSS